MANKSAFILMYHNAKKWMHLAKPVDKNKWPALNQATNDILIYSPRTMRFVSFN